MVAIIMEKEPDLLTRFKCSECFVRDYYSSVLEWSLRKATYAAAHLPANAPDLCEQAFFRLVYAMKWYNIPPELVINVDQVGVWLLPNNSYTFHEKGAHQVDIVAKDKKQCYTALTASTVSGAFLSFQQVWARKTTGSLLSHDAPRMADALAHSFYFASAASVTSPWSHFSTLKTMKEWIMHILIPYYEHVLTSNPDYPED
ncbi:uncharacterized protein EV420DRAFT_1654962 [Desarmillaria tabescens]|uniref:Uncharacterized protein n=1 Tax=Armillaria tabescens TaxID=1929756 RepID=A0AA39MGR2_ARMTA|nr:uncharacterized protein EV420DRAFT_1654962 [Desarmillaria tabescens]KAK0433129.1 hypothetical protein EV420DRAFT_1654962 [Desarmillaria tabescens]